MSELRPALILLILLTLITGAGYPLAVTLLGQWWFPGRSAGSLIEEKGIVRGSLLIGQNFTQPGYFQGRPSATSDAAYNPLASSGSNLGPTNPALLDAVSKRVAGLRAANPQSPRAVPVELVTASASGLDPEISPAAARWQIPRIAAARHLTPHQLEQLIDEKTTVPRPAFIGEPTVNVLALNITLDHLKQ